MLDVEGGFNPLVKDIALDSSGYIFALLTYEKEDDSKEIRVQKYDQVKPSQKNPINPQHLFPSL